MKGQIEFLLMSQKSGKGRALKRPCLVTLSTGAFWKTELRKVAELSHLVGGRLIVTLKKTPPAKCGDKLRLWD